MAITYNNPDEVVKVKHILSLAEHIAEKIDGSSSGSGSGSGSGSSTTSKTTPILSASVTTLSIATFNEESGIKKFNGTCALTYNGDGNIFFDQAAVMAGLGFSVWKISGKQSFQPFFYTSMAPTNLPLTFKVGFTETENYKACFVELTLTA